MATKTKTKPESPEITVTAVTAVTTEFIVIDYNGFVGQPPRKRGIRAQRRVSHTYNPRHWSYPEEGQVSMMLYPGANVVKRELWEFYLAHERTVAPLKKRGVLKVLDALPDEESLIRDKTGLIARTKSPAGLDWIEKMEKAGENRDFVLETIDARRPYARELDIELGPFASHRQSFDAAQTRQAGREPNAPTVAF